MIITEAGHCWITFKNGYTVSMFNGCGSYTENHLNMNLDTTRFESTKVEIAILYGNNFCTQSFFDEDIGDDVTTINVNELPDLIKKVSDIKAPSL